MADELEQVVLEAKFQSRMMPALIDELFGTAPSSSHIALSSLPPEMLTIEPTPSDSALASARLLGSEGRRAVVGEPEPDNGSGRASGPRSVVERDTERSPDGSIDLGDASARRVPLRRRSRLLLAAGVIGTVAGLGLAVAMLPTRAPARPARLVAPISTTTSTATATARAPAASGAAATGSETTIPAAGASAVPGGHGPGSVNVHNAFDDARSSAAGGAADETLERQAGPMHGDGGARLNASAAASRATRPGSRGAAVRAAPRARVSRVDAASTRKSTGRIGGDRVAKGLSIDPFAEAAARSGEK